ncbi:hypothetical protein Fmac_031022 [Flemingia macrophylla]|uniref:DUF659 domain-containing protein n=1 Tax=Flemingia macrophylla TaxID=520843 RepID=A0ABD1L0X2_9FABA
MRTLVTIRGTHDSAFVVSDFNFALNEGGITKAKKHQLGLKGDIGACRKIPKDLKFELKAAYESKFIDIEVSIGSLEENEDEDDIQVISRMKRPSSISTEHTSTTKRNGTNVKSPLDLLFARKSEESIKVGKGMRLTSLNDNKEAKAMVIQYITRFFYRNEIAFNVVRSKSFKLMIKAIDNYGLHLKPPSYHKLRVPLLTKELKYTRGLLKSHEEKIVQYGCSIMSDGWMDRKNRTSINFLVNCLLGTMFVKSVMLLSTQRSTRKC